jgi:hypothetical protein
VQQELLLHSSLLPCCLTLLQQLELHHCLLQLVLVLALLLVLLLGVVHQGYQQQHPQRQVLLQLSG